jgi:hypothetical protein
MTGRRLQGRFAACCYCAVACAAGAAWACDVPVHLWALERWAPDPYPVFVFHEGDLSPVQQAALDRLKEGAAGANIAVRTVDLNAALDEPTRAVWEAQVDAEPPWMVVRHPMGVPLSVSIWSGPLDEAAVVAVVDSPKRREVARELVKGDAVAWVLLDGDDAAARIVTDTTEELRRNPPPPTPTPGMPASARVFPVPRFPIIHVKRNDPGEDVFIAMLLGVEPDLKGYAEPMAFPVFGRGRALYALVGPGINPKTVRGACTFLLGACSCQVKEQNPGMDLLLAVDWNAYIGDPQEIAKASLPPLPGVLQKEALAAPPAAPPAASPMLRNLLVALVLGGLAVAGTSVALWRQRSAKFHG